MQINHTQITPQIKGKQQKTTTKQLNQTQTATSKPNQTTTPSKTRPNSKFWSYTKPKHPLKVNQNPKSKIPSKHLKRQTHKHQIPKTQAQQITQNSPNYNKTQQNRQNTTKTPKSQQNPQNRNIQHKTQ